MIEIPASLTAQRSVMDEQSRTWLRRLPATVAGQVERRGLVLGPPFPRLSYNYAAPVTLADGTPAVLKACLPDEEFRWEVQALLAFGGRACVRLVDVDWEDGVMLLERLEPGRPIIDLPDDDEATVAAVEVMKQLWRPAPAGMEFPDLAYWFRGFRPGTPAYERTRGPLPAGIFAHTADLVWRLIGDTAQPVLLHGDLNYGNVLSAQRAPWLAIDPKGITGDPCFDTAILLHDPGDRILAASDPAALLVRRIDLIAAHTPFTRERIRGWGVAYAVLSAAWSAEEEGTGWEPAAEIAEILAGL